jgi:hypothetical protein
MRVFVPTTDKVDVISLFCDCWFGKETLYAICIPYPATRFPGFIVTDNKPALMSKNDFVMNP